MLEKSKICNPYAPPSSFECAPMYVITFAAYASAAFWFALGAIAGCFFASVHNGILALAGIAAVEFESMLCRLSDPMERLK